MTRTQNINYFIYIPHPASRSDGFVRAKSYQDAVNRIKHHLRFHKHVKRRGDSWYTQTDQLLGRIEMHFMK